MSAKEQEDVMSEGRAMDSESASVVAEQLFFFFVLWPFCQKIADCRTTSMQHYASVICTTGYKVQDHRQIKSAEATQPSQPSSIPLKRILKRTQLSRCLFCMEGLVMQMYMCMYLYMYLYVYMYMYCTCRCICIHVLLYVLSL